MWLYHQSHSKTLWYTFDKSMNLIGVYKIKPWKITTNQCYAFILSLKSLLNIDTRLRWLKQSQLCFSPKPGRSVLTPRNVSSNDNDSNTNVKKAKCVISKTTTMHACSVLSGTFLFSAIARLQPLEISSAKVLNWKGWEVLVFNSKKFFVLHLKYRGSWNNDKEVCKDRTSFC